MDTRLRGYDTFSTAYLALVSYLGRDGAERRPSDLPTSTPHRPAPTTNDLIFRMAAQFKKTLYLWCFQV